MKISFFILFLVISWACAAQQVKTTKNSTPKKYLTASDLQYGSFGSKVVVNQSGTNNNSTINFTSNNGGVQLLNQSGVNNNYEFYNSFNTDKPKISVEQSGILNSIEIYGNNSLMNNFSIKQKANFKKVIIKNFKN